MQIKDIAPAKKLPPSDAASRDMSQYLSEARPAEACLAIRAGERRSDKPRLSEVRSNRLCDVVAQGVFMTLEAQAEGSGRERPGGSMWSIMAMSLGRLSGVPG